MYRVAFFAAIFFLEACSSKFHVKIANRSDKPVLRIEALNLSALGLNNLAMNKYLLVQNENRETVASQLIDINLDGIADEVVIKVNIPGKSTVRYRLLVSKKPVSDEIKNRTYCRFVPERLDDFAWENDKVAFRTYGPAYQKLFEQGNPAGLISSGIDCWLKRVEYPIIDKWYKKSESGGSYHNDDGEGLDNFQVGLSRGCGGTAIRYNGGFVFSGNFSKSDIVTNGPLRSIFILKYDPVLLDGKPVTETKTFTIDVGDNFFRCDVKFESDLSIDTLAVGLTLHENKGRSDCSADGWISYWEPIDDSEIGMGAWVNREAMSGCLKIENAGEKLNHVWLFAAPQNKIFTYYSGFGWKKAGQFDSEESWKEYINKQNVSLGNPLSVSVE